jgi:hypothetical protein
VTPSELRAERARTEADRADDAVVAMQDRLQRLSDCIGTMLGQWEQSESGQPPNPAAWAQLTKTAMELDQVLRKQAAHARLEYERAQRAKRAA